jgi:hypothetical protein
VTGTGQAIRAVDLLFENSGGRALKLLFYRGRYAATDPGEGPAEVVDTLLA